MRETQDGFRIAEEDLKQRGPGDVLGTRQTGEQQFRVADLAIDAHLVGRATDIAARIIATRPDVADALSPPGRLRTPTTPRFDVVLPGQISRTFYTSAIRSPR